ncbi:hypothetical protein CDD80_5221 [Ophiocordyceps camponoti-rufipedis]|uniref:NodB homology domain-containing protein n=1 Tax=Ophiocordyceps camponoti-rufipedis TaxID=2004952 RepID=A0A2C5YPS5_9HYPO|nr:hypothetical protein CDD80_5221 [Ophiocordyceps camponoti-rufipedis]
MLPLLLVGGLLSLAVRAEEPSWANRLNSSVPFGTIITKCTVPDTFALTFDDGPFDFTPGLLKTLKDAEAKATFFVNGDNFAKIEDRRCVLKQMLNEGHQIGSHGFQHDNLTDLDENGIEQQMFQLETRLLDNSSIQMAPTYMRPPFFSTDERVLAVMKKLQYHVIQADVDTKDFGLKTEDVIQTAVDNFKQGLDRNGSISLMHDVNGPTVSTLVPKALELLKAKGKKLVTVGECLGDPPHNWYRVRDGTTGVSLNSTVCKEEETSSNRLGKRDENSLDGMASEGTRDGKSKVRRGAYSIRQQLVSEGNDELAEHSLYLRALIRQ